MHEDVDRAIVLGESEEISEADQRDEQVDRETCESVLDAEAQPEGSERECGDETQKSHVHVTPGSDHEHGNEHDDADGFQTHQYSQPL